MLRDHIDDTIVIPALRGQLDMFGTPAEPGGRCFSAPDIELDYDHIIVCMSGGKDSIAAFLHLLDCGVDRSRIELWHHDVDGREGSTLMDWVFMREYVERFGETFGVPVYFSWLEGGFESEMLKQDAYSRPHIVQTPEGTVSLLRDMRRTAPATRRRYPQQSSSLQTRWCSSALKIDVGRRALTNQARFNGKRVLFITGERREESANRAKYFQLERHATDRRDGRLARHVDAWRAVLHWSEEQVWDALARHRVVAPVPYRLGWSRSSCMTCIYNSARIWATILRYFPHRAEAIVAYEREFGVTISREKLDVMQLAERAMPIEIVDLEALEQACSETYTLPILLKDAQKWERPAGAFGSEGCGSD